jgi:uncharacterized membrane protein
MRNNFKTILLLALIFIVFATGESKTQHFTINNFQSDIVIDEDGSFTVSETITVNFHREKHGIYREIPFRYEDELGNSFLMPIEVFSVTDENGSDLTNRVRKTGNVVNVRIGDADRYVNGEQIYKLFYKVKNGLLYFDDHDELYWNITGNFWDAEIEQVRASVSLNSSVESQKLDYTCFTGGYGASGSDCNFEQATNGGVFYTTKILESHDGFTIAFSFDKGIVAEPSNFDNFLLLLNLSENWGFVLPIISLLFMISHWRTKGRDPAVRQAIMVKYKPPKVDGKELTAAEVGTLIDESLHPRDISASMIGLAVKGYLKIEESEEQFLVFSHKDYKITALKTDISELTEFEKWLMTGLFSDGQSVVMISDLKNKFYKYLPKLSKSIYKQLVSYNYFSTSPQHTIGKYVGYGVLVLILTGASQLIFMNFTLSLKLTLVSIFTASPFFIFSKIMPAKTRKGALALADILGFQEFLERAERDKLERMEDKDLFSKYLPYAIALDVVDRWAKAFEGIEQNMPNWYVGSHGMTHFHSVAFSQAINATTSHLSTATFSAPRSSGTSGGGGFSGGGGGGGGGGSW